MTEPQLQVEIPDDVQGGVYANMAAVWHTPYEFTIDFAVLQPPNSDRDGNPIVPARVVARVKFPPSQIFQLLQAINSNMGLYEQQYGAIQEPGGQHPPNDT